MKYILFIFLSFLISCGLSEYNTSKIMRDLDINEVNKNELKEKLNSGNGFYINDIKKVVSLYSGLAYNITNSGNIPLIISLKKGFIKNFQDLYIKIYSIDTNGDRQNEINIVSNNIINYTTYQEIYIYTSDLNSNTTYEIYINAKNTKSEYGFYLDNDGDGIDGESEDDLIKRFCTGGLLQLIQLKYPNPLVTINVPSLNPGTLILISNYLLSKNLTDITNGANIDITSIKEAIKLFNISENKYYTIDVNYIGSNTTIEITFSSNLPVGAYKLTVDKRKIKEANPIYGYIHRGSYEDNYNYNITSYSFLIRTTNTQPSLNITKQDNQIALIESPNVSLDMKTINKSNIIISEISNNITIKRVDFDIVTLNKNQVLIKAKGTAYDFKFNNISDNQELVLYVNLHKIRSIYGDVISFNASIYK